MTDKIGVEIPPHAFKFWQRTPEVQFMLTAITRVSSALRRADADKDPMFGEVRKQDACDLLGQVYTMLKQAKPHAVCLRCDGKGCKICFGRGLLSEFRWERAIPNDDKTMWLKSKNL